MDERQEIQETAVAIPEKARAVDIRCEDDLAAATGFLTTIKGLRKRIGDTFDPIIRKAHEAHKEALAKKKEVEAPLQEGEKIVKKAIGGYLEEQERIRREAEEKARKERERQEREKRDAEEAALAAAAKAEEEGKAAEAAKILDEAEAEIEKPIESAPVPEVPKAGGGVSTRKVWRFEITDEDAIPREYCSPDERKIKNSLVGCEYKRQIPGVRVYQETVVSARAR